MNLVWHADNLWERDWIRFIFDGQIGREIFDADMSCDIDDAVHVLGGGLRPLIAYDAYFASLRARGRRMFLFHASDEWFSGHYATYRHFDGVFRNFLFGAATGDGVTTLPLGYPNGGASTHAGAPASARPLAWSFVGQVKSSRRAMLRAFAGIAPQRFIDTGGFGPTPKALRKPDYDAILRDSAFAPCPMGNVILETWRFYEALEAGAIPLIERRPRLDYYRDLLGPHPAPTFSNWDEAAAYVVEMRAAPRQLDALQGEVVTWWAQAKHAIQTSCARTLNEPSRHDDLAAFARRPVARHRLLFEAERLAALMRHQTAATLLNRATNLSGPLRRLRAEMRDARGS